LQNRTGTQNLAQAMDRYLPEMLVKVLLTMAFVMNTGTAATAQKSGVAPGPNGATCVKGVNNQGCKR
jgi:hypothetical protein